MRNPQDRPYRYEDHDLERAIGQWIEDQKGFHTAGYPYRTAAVFQNDVEDMAEFGRTNPDHFIFIYSEKSGKVWVAPDVREHQYLLESILPPGMYDQ